MAATPPQPSIDTGLIVRLVGIADIVLGVLAILFGGEFLPAEGEILGLRPWQFLGGLLILFGIPTYALGHRLSQRARTGGGGPVNRG